MQQERGVAVGGCKYRSDDSRIECADMFDAAMMLGRLSLCYDGEEEGDGAESKDGSRP